MSSLRELSQNEKVAHREDAEPYTYEGTIVEACGGGYVVRWPDMPAELQFHRRCDLIAPGDPKLTLKPVSDRWLAALQALIAAASEFDDAFAEHNDDVHAYPAYLPNFSEFVHDLVHFRDQNHPTFADSQAERAKEDERNGERQVAYNRVRIELDQKDRDALQN